MRITADTNLLVRVVLGDDELHSRIATQTLSDAELVAVTLPMLCEFVWVLARGYKVPREFIAAAIENLIDSSKIKVERPAVAAGLAMLRAGGDFADAVIAFEGGKLGGMIFASFDRVAVEKVGAAGGKSMLLGADEAG